MMKRRSQTVRHQNHCTITVLDASFTAVKNNFINLQSEFEEEKNRNEGMGGVPVCNNFQRYVHMQLMPIRATLN